MKTNDSSHYDPRNPIWDLPYDPKGGQGLLKANVWGKYFGQGEDESREAYFLYTWSETVNGIEVEILIDKQFFCFEPSALQEDIYNAMKQEMKFDTINYITK